MAGFTQTHQTKIVNAFLLRFPFIYLFIAAWNTVPMLATIGALHFGASVKHELQLLSQNTECNRKCMFEPTSLRSIYFYLFYLLIFFCYSRFFDFVCRLHLNIMQSCLRVIFVFFFFLLSKESFESGTMMGINVIILHLNSRSLSILLRCRFEISVTTTTHSQRVSNLTFVTFNLTFNAWNSRTNLLRSIQ